MGVLHAGHKEESVSMSGYAQSRYDGINDALSIPERQSQNL
jgi:hypothetical protein